MDVEGRWSSRQTPHERIFTRTHDELDPELWYRDKLKPKVRDTLIEKVDQHFKGKFKGWKNWSRLYFAGSQASYWGGNRDLDLLLGVDYNRFRSDNPDYKDMSDEEISDMLNAGFYSEFNEKGWKSPWAKSTQRSSSQNSSQE